MGLAIVAIIVVLYFVYKKYYAESFTPDQTNRARAIVMFLNRQAANKKSDFAAYARFLVNSRNPYRALETVQAYYALYDSAVKGTIAISDVAVRMQ